MSPSAQASQWPGCWLYLDIWKGIKLSDLISGYWKDCNVPGRPSSLRAKLLTGQLTGMRDNFSSDFSQNLSLLAFILMAMQDKFMGGAQSQPRSASELLSLYIPEW